MQPPRRQTNPTGAQARRAVAPTLMHFEAWRSSLTLLIARSERRFSDEEQIEMLSRCIAIDAELLEARTGLLLDLADAPAPVSGHSRVVDVEKALDGVAATVAGVRRRLEG